MDLTLRSWAERLTRSLWFKRRLPPPFDSASIYVSPSAGLGYAFKSMASIDPLLLRCAETFVRPGDTVWDIGANVGLFAVAAAARAGAQGQIVAFEPDVWLAQLLRRTNEIRPSSSAPMTIVPAAVAKDIAIRDFAMAARARSSNALAEYGGSQMGGVTKRHSVPAFNLDWLLTQLPAPNLIKIDVEGAELEVLRGQSLMLEKVRPVILCEVGSANADAITALLTAARYRLYDGERPLEPNNSIDHAAWSTVALPVEHSDRYLPR